MGLGGNGTREGYHGGIMSTDRAPSPDRRTFLRNAGLGVTAVGALFSAETAGQSSVSRQLTDAEKLSRLAMTCWPQRPLFKAYGRRTPNEETLALRKKYGEITMLDFPQWTKDPYPGRLPPRPLVRRLWRPGRHLAVHGDQAGAERQALHHAALEPERARVPEMAGEAGGHHRENEKFVCQHISNNAPQFLADPDDEKRQEGIRVAKLWMDLAAVLGAKTMRANTGVSGTRIMPEADDHATGYPKNDKIVVYLKKCIESFKELADYGEKVGVKITIENHWGLCANPMNIRIIMDEVNHPFCECTPDFGNWEHEYHLFHGLEAVMPYTHTHVHAKYWDRWKTPEKDWNDVGRSVRILNAHRFKGTIALEWENGPMDGIEGTQWLMKEVLAAL